MDTETNSKKVSLEDLPKDELIKKCKGLLNILQKARQSKESLIEENNNLKEKLKTVSKTSATGDSDSEMLESLIQQKIQLVTSLEEIKSQKKVLENKLKESEYNLSNATDKIVDLDNENQGCRRQISRLVEENEQLLARLDSLERETEQLKEIGIKQQQQLLALEEGSVSTEVSNYEALKTRFEQLEKTYNQVHTSNKELAGRNEELLEKREQLNQNIKELEENNETMDKIIAELKVNIQEKKEENERLNSIIYNFNVELTEYKSLNEKLKLDLLNFEGLSNEVCLLKETNDKLKDKLKLFHSKIVKFASDVKVLKQEKVELLNNFKDYLQQGKLWENQLREFSTKVINQFNEFENEKSQLTLKYDSLKIEFDSMEKENLKLNIYNKELSDFVEALKLKSNNDQSEKLYLDNKLLTERLNNVIKQIEEFKIELDFLRGERNLLKEQYDDLMMLRNKDQKVKSNIEEEQQLLKTQNASLLSSLQQLTSDLESQSTCNELLQQNIQDYKNIIKTLEDKISKLSEENVSIFDKHTALQETLFEAQNKCAIQKEQLTILKKENSELLTEMNEMNQVLKDRGETISKQQEYCEELLKNVKLLESENKKYLEFANEKDHIIKKLEEDINALKNSALSQIVPNDNEIQNAIIAKQNAEINLLQNEISALKEKLLHMQESSQEFCYAESETLSTSTISRAEDMSRLKDLEESWEERYGKLRSLALKLKGKIREISDQLTKEQNEKNELQQKLASSHKTIQMLQSQLDSSHDDLDNNKAELASYLKKLDTTAHEKSTYLKQLADYDELVIKLKSDIEALNREKSNTDSWKKQVSVKVQNLKRELEANLLVKKDLEEQIKKLNMDLDDKSKLLNEEIEKHNATKNSLLESHNECKRHSVLNLEIQDYERSLKEFTQKLDKKQETITKLKNQVDQQKSTISALKEQNRLLEERIQSEETDLSGARGELQTYKKRASDLELILIEKEEKLLHLTHTLENSRAENEELSTQLSKVVADNQKICDFLKSEKQLLHNQNSGLEMKLREMNDTIKSKEEELREIRKEYDAYKVRAQSVLRQTHVRDVGFEEKLTEEVASFRAQVEVLSSEITDLRGLSKSLKDDNSKLLLEKESLETKLQDIEGALEEQKQLYNALSTKHQKMILENQETISSLKVHADTLSQCYRQQLSEQEARHNKEIIELQSRIERVTPVAEPPPLIPPTTPREQGEGSECVEVTNTKISHPLPLDKLLNNELEQDVGFLRKQISEHETKVNYLTSLLADTEQDLVKHVQMNKLLKEEIRRYQRSVEREKHAENLEYLKNVVFKFATLNSGDERSRLVPVLNTILKFSPEESNQLNLVARGEVSGRGWSDYLPIWSSSKPQ